MDATFAWFAERGITLEKTGSAREYGGRVSGFAGVELELLSAGEIPAELATGRLHLGVTGSDLVHERIFDHAEKLRSIARMGFGHADLIVAVPDFWADVRSLHDLDAAAAQFRAETGKRLRIATKYHRLVREYLRRHGVADYQLVDSQGATEGTVKNERAEAIADITTTGATLRDNHLRILEAPVIHASQANLFASKVVELSPEESARFASFEAIVTA
ncbi:MAG: ATP phosphoribosyltransferase [Pseudomonadota bacterium]